MKANIFFFIILIAMGLAIVVCRDVGTRCVELGPVTPGTENMKLVFRHR
jgi:hypothetical protein